VITSATWCKCNCLHWRHYIKPWFKDWAWHVEPAITVHWGTLSCPAVLAAENAFHLMAKSDIIAGSELITSELHWFAVHVENTPVWKNSGTTIWTVKGFSVLSVNFPYFRSVEWQQCQAVMPASTEQLAPLYMHIAQYRNLPTLCQGDGTFLEVQECHFEVVECKLEVTEWQYSWI